MTAWVSRLRPAKASDWQAKVRERPLRPDHERIVKLKQAAKDYALRMVGVPAWDAVPEVDELVAEAADEFPEVAEHLERERQAHLTNPANWTPGLLPREHPDYHACCRLFEELKTYLDILTSSTVDDWAMFSVTGSFEALTHLTAILSRWGMADITPLLDMADELGVWACNACPRDPPSPLQKPVEHACR